MTPGTAVDGSIVDRDGCYLIAWASDESGGGAAYVDVSTGDFFVSKYDGLDDPRFRDDLTRFGPLEIIVAKSVAEDFVAPRDGMTKTPVEDSFFDRDRSFDLLVRHFGTQSLRGFGLEKGDARVLAAGAALRYAATNHRNDLGHIARLRVESGDGSLVLDAATLENLGIRVSRDGQAKSSLLGVVNATRTSMGGRTLRKWISAPLVDREAIFNRHDAVAELTHEQAKLDRVGSTLAGIADLERLTTRVALRTASPRECLTLGDSLDVVAELRTLTSRLKSPLFTEILEAMDPLEEVARKISSTLQDNPSASAKDGGVIREGVDAALDELRSMTRDSKSILLEIEATERSESGIGSLKVRFNNVFGYYIEVSKSNLSKVPDRYIRKQTLVNAERFITPELKEVEEKILNAEEKSVAIETRLYDELLDEVGKRSADVLSTAAAVASLDSIQSFAEVALRNRWVRPELSDVTEIEISEGRHPVVETLTERLIPNDTHVDRAENGIQIITGPNMGGKSTYLRQVALIVLLCQAGSFVPAKTARIGLFDRIFTRVGASDNLARGESTFMVEMHETANILNNATDRSLVILDEVGRGTATFDGLSLAWAIVEYLHDTASRAAVTLFATHYHELTDLAKTNPRVCNYNVSVKEWNDQIIFLRKVIPGSADKSYGIHVAKLAGIPGSVVDRAERILETLERKEVDVVEATRNKAPAQTDKQLGLFGTDDRGVISDLRGLSLDSMTPMEALKKIDEWKKRFS